MIGTALVLLLSEAMLGGLVLYDPVIAYLHAPRELQDADLRHLEGQLWISDSGQIKARIHNDTGKRVPEITVQLTIYQPDGVTTRRYRLTTEDGAPLADSEYGADSSDVVGLAGQRWTWELIAAKGQR